MTQKEINKILWDEIKRIALEKKRENAKRLKKELSEAKEKVKEFKRTVSREAIDRKYF